AQHALPLWRELESATSTDLLRITGGIDVGNSAYLEACGAALRSCGARAQRIGPQAARERFPWLTVRDQGCIFSPDTGVLAADKALHAIADAARNAGARIMDSSPCDRLVVAEDHVDVLVGNNEVRTRRLVVAA